MRTMTPVLIGGCPRAGTTLLGAMLGAHDRALTVPESQFKVSLLAWWDAAQPRPTGPEVIERAFRFRRLRLWDIDRDRITFDADDLSSFPRLFQRLLDAYGERVDRPGRDLWIDHTPENIRAIGALVEAFPEARCLHLVRDGRAVAASVIPLDWGPNTIFRAAEWWMARTCPGLAAECALGPEKIMRVRYEDLVCHPEPTLREICRFLEIDYQPAMLEADGFVVPGYTSTQHQLVGRRPDPSRVDRWRQTLTPRQIENFETTAGDLLRLLEYPVETHNALRSPRIMERLILDVLEMVRVYGVNVLRSRVRKKPIA